MNSAYANDELKIKTVRQIYENGIKNNQYDLPIYATSDFAKAIKNIEMVVKVIENGKGEVKKNAIDDGLDCLNSRPLILHPLSWDITQPFKKTFSVNKKGHVVAKLSYQLNSQNQLFVKRYFILKQSGNSYQVDDLILIRPDKTTYSYKAALQKSCWFLPKN